MGCSKRGDSKVIPNIKTKERLSLRLELELQYTEWEQPHTEMILPWTERTMEKEGDRSLIITKKFQGMFICSICFFSTTEDVGVKDRVLVYEKRIVY